MQKSPLNSDIICDFPQVVWQGLFSPDLKAYYQAERKSHTKGWVHYYAHLATKTLCH